MSPPTDAIIAGQGLAGTALAWILLQRGASVRLFDPGLPSASSVAAGLVTPVTGRALRADPDFEANKSLAAKHYISIEHRLRERFWFERPALRIATTPEQSERLTARLAATDSGLVSTGHGSALGWRSVINCADMPGAARLDVAAYVTASGQHFEKMGIIERSAIQPEDVMPAGEGVKARDYRARYLIWCRGYHDAGNPWLPENALSPAKGEIIHLRLEGWQDRMVTHCGGHWLMPRADDASFAFGATYDHADRDPAPTRAAREQLAATAAKLLRVSFEVVGQRAGIRPVGRQRRPVTGAHAVHRQILTLNGLGSKGVLWAPGEAAKLADLIMGKRPAAAP